MKKIIFIKFIVTLMTISPLEIWAQDEVTPSITEENKLDFSLGADVVSSYIWRGAYSAGTSIQPGMGLEFMGVSLSAWGSVDVASIGFKEFDLSLGYSFMGIELMITDYWWAGEGAFDYFKYKKDVTAHLFEATVVYTLPFEKFPLRLTWNTMFAGADYKADGDRAYSTYIEVSYPFSIKEIGLDVGLGLTPWDGLYHDDFGVVGVSLKASKDIKITDSFHIPLFGQVIANPSSEDVFLVLGVSF